MIDECPICSEPLKVDRAFAHDQGVLCEEYHACPNGHYYWDYAYGNYRWLIGNSEFDGWYGEAYIERIVRDATIEAAIQLNKSGWGRVVYGQRLERDGAGGC